MIDVNIWIYATWGLLAIIALGAAVLLGGVLLSGREKTASKKVLQSDQTQTQDTDKPFKFGGNAQFVLDNAPVDERVLRTSALKGQSVPSSSQPKPAQIKRPGSFFDQGDDFRLP